MSNTVYLVSSSQGLIDYWARVPALAHARHLAQARLLDDTDPVQEALILLDIPDGSEHVALYARCCQHNRLLALSSHPNDTEAIAWLRTGAAGYAHALTPLHQLAIIIDTLGGGGIWIGRDIMQQVCRHFGQRLPSEASWSTRVSGREAEVVEALRAGLSNKEIARQLGITERTVKAHLTSVFQKLGVSDRLQLMLKLIDTGH